MRTLQIVILLIAIGLFPACTSAQNYAVEPITDGLENPWAMTFLPNGDMLVTERPGRLRVVRNGELLADAVSEVPAVFAQGQGGLLDVELHPEFASNGLVYLSYSKPMGDNSTTAVARGTYSNGALTGVEDIFVADTRGRGHYGSRLAFDRDGYLFITVGDRQAPPRGDLRTHPAQDVANHHGTVIRLHDDGSVPEDNPFVGQDGAKPEIWSYGHRNAQGLAIHPETNDVWINEHGPQGGDELNRSLPGLNYGWPVVGYGVNYGGSNLHDAVAEEGMEQPKHYWVPSIATSGLLIYTGSAFPEWQGNMFVGGLAGQQIARLTMDGRAVASEETLFANKGRVRDLHQGPDGNIYIVIDGSASQQTLLRMVPASR